MSATGMMRLWVRGRLALALAACASGPLWAFDAAQAVADASEPAIALSTSQQTVLSSVPQAAGPGDGRLSFATATQSMVWAGRGRLAWGLGVEQRWRAPAWAQFPEGPAADREGVLLLGVAVRTGQHARLVWQSPHRLGTAGSEIDGAESRLLPLDLRRGDSYRSMLRGSLRMELGHGTAISLKPRGRRIGVALTSQW